MSMINYPYFPGVTIGLEQEPTFPFDSNVLLIADNQMHLLPTATWVIAVVNDSNMQQAQQLILTGYDSAAGAIGTPVFQLGAQQFNTPYIWPFPGLRLQNGLSVQCSITPNANGIQVFWKPATT